MSKRKTNLRSRNLRQSNHDSKRSRDTVGRRNEEAATTTHNREQYTESDSKIGRWQGGALTLDQAQPTPKQLNLKGWAQADLKVSGCPTQPEPIVESRAVYQDNGRRGGQKTSSQYGSEHYRKIGHLGGEATAATHGREFYQDIGRKGGQKVSEEYGPEHYREIGQRGGEATAATHERGFYQGIGQLGGEATAATHGREFYQDIGQRGGEATSATHDRAFYQDIGRKGGQKVSEESGSGNYLGTNHRKKQSSGSRQDQRDHEDRSHRGNPSKQKEEREMATSGKEK